MNNSYSIHHICSFMVRNQLSGHSYSVPALCESLSKNMSIQFHTTGKSNLLFSPSFQTHEYKVDRFLSSILSSKDFKSGLKKTINNGDIIHSHQLWRMPNIYPLLIRKNKNIRIIISPRGALAKENLNISKYKKYIFNKIFGQNKMLSNCDAFHATSIKEKNEIRALGYRQPIAIIPNGVHIPLKKKVDFNSKNNIKFLYLGRIHPIKGIDLLIETWADIELKNRNCSLEICGYYEDVQYYNHLKNTIKKLGLKNIFFSSKVSGIEKEKKYLENDIFIMLSKSENFGLVIAEAMSYGLPVIISNQTPWSVVKTNNYGWVTSLNKKEISSAIFSAINSNPENLKKMGGAGRVHIKDNFSWDLLSKSYITFYEWLRNGGSNPSFMDIL
jgi:glycosyltransferase involved in cell wall biosynthesis